MILIVLMYIFQVMIIKPKKESLDKNVQLIKFIYLGTYFINMTYRILNNYVLF